MNPDFLLGMALGAGVVVLFALFLAMIVDEILRMQHPFQNATVSDFMSKTEKGGE